MIDLLRKRLADYAATDARQEEQALKEILQEVALYALWRTDFFEVAAFQGGTSLRLLRGLRRFWEDLDFILKSPNADFAWSSYFDELVAVLAEFGVRCELSDRQRVDVLQPAQQLRDIVARARIQNDGGDILLAELQLRIDDGAHSGSNREVDEGSRCAPAKTGQNRRRGIRKSIGNQ